MKILKTFSPNFLEEIKKPPKVNVDFTKVEASFTPDNFPGRYEFKAKYNGVDIGTIEYFIRKRTNSLVISVISIDQAYSGQKLGLWMYRQLINFAKNQGLSYFTSDSVVQGGSLACWRKLDKDDELNVQVSTECSADYAEFIDTYESGRIFKRAISDTNGAVFKIIL